MAAKTSFRAVFAIALVVAFLAGALARQILLVAEPSPGPEPSIAPVTARVQTAEDVARTRQALVDFLFGSPSLPESRPVEHGDGTYTVAMANGIESHVRLFRPSEPNGRLVLYHAGHAGYGAPDELVVTDLIERGYAILLFEMPFVGVNASPIKFELPNGPVTISRHDHMSFLASRTTGSPIRYFVEPVVVMLNELSAEFDDVSMIGLSGGGWTTVLAAAIDTRIDRSYQAAGTLPLAVGFVREDSWGDYEQTDHGLYTIADYPDLYVLGAFQRRQMQILNEHDPCCFGGDHRSLYEPQVQGALETAGVGSFSVYLDTRNRQHSISRAALDAIIVDIEDHPAG